MVSAASPITPQRSEPNSALSVVAERVLTKNAWRLLPLLAFASFVHYMDRTNIAFAALSMNRDLGLTAAEFGTAASIFYLGYVLVCIPTRHARSPVGGCVRDELLKLQEALYAHARTLASDAERASGAPPAPSGPSSPWPARSPPEPKAVSFDFQSGVKTTVFRDGAQVDERFDPAAMKGLAGAHPVRAPGASRP